MPYFTTTEFRERYPELTAAAGYTDAKVTATRDLAEQTIEDACGVAFEPRTSTVRRSGTGTTLLRLPRAYVRDITAVTDAGVAVALTDVAVTEADQAYLPAGWTRGVGNLTVTFTHGLDAPPLRVKQAAMILTREWLVRGPVSERATQYVASDAGDVVNLLTPGFQGSFTGVPEVDAVIRQYRAVSVA